jgi:hypothetical protein
MFRLAAAAFSAVLLAHPPGLAQDRAAKSPGEAPVKRTIFTLLHADPDATAEILGHHFEGQAKVSTLPDGLLVSASPAVMEDLTKLLARLDRKPQSVEVEVALLDVRRGADGKEPDISDAARIDALVKAGQATVQRIRVTAIEGRPVSSNTSGDKPYTAAMTVAGGLAGGGRGASRRGGVKRARAGSAAVGRSCSGRSTTAPSGRRSN